MGKRVQTLTTPSSGDSLQRKKSKKFYQTKEWKQVRNNLKKKRREHHEQIVIDIYKKNPDNKPEDLQAFLQSDMPLCEVNLKKNRIKVASVLDHKMRIRAGGSKYSPSNLQWITKELHDSKSGKEAHE